MLRVAEWPLTVARKEERRSVPIPLALVVERPLVPIRINRWEELVAERSLIPLRVPQVVTVLAKPEVALPQQHGLMVKRKWLMAMSSCSERRLIS